MSYYFNNGDVATARLGTRFMEYITRPVFAILNVMCPLCGLSGVKDMHTHRCLLETRCSPTPVVTKVRSSALVTRVPRDMRSAAKRVVEHNEQDSNHSQWN